MEAAAVLLTFKRPCRLFLIRWYVLQHSFESIGLVAAAPAASLPLPDAPPVAAAAAADVDAEQLPALSATADDAAAADLPLIGIEARGWC